MGYYADVIDSRITLKAECRDKAGRLKKLLHDHGYELVFDDKDGAAQVILMWGKLSSSEDCMFEKIAPWVVDGSYIEMRGEGDNYWRRIFRYGKSEEHYAELKLIWPEDARLEGDKGYENALIEDASQ